MVLLAAFLLAGMFRVALALLCQPANPLDPGPSIYRGVIVESSKGSSVMELDEPSDLSGTRALIRSDRPVTIGDRLTMLGSMREIAVTFRNPNHISWKWIRRLEGTFCEVRGEILSLEEGKKVIGGWRRYLGAKVDRSGASHTAVIKALTIGDTTGLDEGTKALFLETGTSHILSISGSHLAVVTGFFFFIVRFAFRLSSRLRQSGADRRYTALVTIPFAVLFMLVAGSGLPTIRATIMIVIYMFALFLEKDRHAENALFLSALAILVIFPHSLFSPSFQLTFVSVLFIILISRIVHPFLARAHRLVRWPISLMVMSLAATLATLPVVLYHFHGFNPLSVIHNLVAVPLMCIITTPLALAGLVLPFGDHLLRLSGEIITVTMAVLESLRWGYIYPFVRPNLPEALLYLAAALSLLFIRRKVVRLAFVAGVLPLLLVTAGVAWEKRFLNHDLCVSYLDVGLGDAILIEAPRGVRLLIDGGGFHGSNFDTGRSVIAPVLLSKKIRTLDYVVNTHPHEDHLGGLRSILRHFRVGTFVAPAGLVSQPAMRSVQNVIRERHIRSLHLLAGDVLQLPFGPEISAYSPPGPIPVEDLNDASVVLRMAFGDRSFLFTGDIGEDMERMLVLSEWPLASSVLKVPHHGSRHSSTHPFISAVKPELAVLSVGPGIRGIPSRETMARYAALSVPIFRTDRDGCVTVCTDGKRLTVERYNDP